MKHGLLLLCLCLGLSACGENKINIVNENSGGTSSNAETQVALVDVKVPLSKMVDALNAKDMDGVRAQIFRGSEFSEDFLVQRDLRNMTQHPEEYKLVLGKLNESSRDKDTVKGTTEITFESKGQTLGSVVYEVEFQQEGDNWKITKFKDLPESSDGYLAVYRDFFNIA